LKGLLAKQPRKPTPARHALMLPINASFAGNSSVIAADRQAQIRTAVIEVVYGSMVFMCRKNEAAASCPFQDELSWGITELPCAYDRALSSHCETSTESANFSARENSFYANAQYQRFDTSPYSLELSSRPSGYSAATPGIISAQTTTRLCSGGDLSDSA